MESLFVLLLLAAGVLAVTKRARIPYSVALVALGIGLASLARLVSGPLPLSEIRISPELILYVFLPTLLYEAAYRLDARLLWRNLLAVLMLAIPGLLLSTLVIGGIVILYTRMHPAAALLLGAILSATDPVAVLALFKQLGAPARLTVLVEGESLFNDATSIVLAKILLVLVLASTVPEGGGMPPDGALVAGALEFTRVFLGGMMLGWVLARIFGTLLGFVEDDPLIEITLTTILAYASFLVAERIGVSGVMATVAAGITMGGWGRTKISSSVAGYVDHFWDYAAFVANALVFLLVGLSVSPAMLWGSMGLLLIVILAMLLSRAALMFIMLPLVGRLPGAERVERGYKTIMFWGGLRGAVALALVLSLPEFEYRELFVTIVSGAVLFTLLVQATTIERVVKQFGLGSTTRGDRLAQAESLLAAEHRVMGKFPALQQQELIPASLVGDLRHESEQQMQRLLSEIDVLRYPTLTRNEELRLLYLRTFAGQRTNYDLMYKSGHLTERAYRYLQTGVDSKIDGMRYYGRVPSVTWSGDRRRQLTLFAENLCASVPGLRWIATSLQRWRVSMEYEVDWARLQSTRGVLQTLESLVHIDPDQVAAHASICQQYRTWAAEARARIDQIRVAQPELVADMQERLARRLVLLAKREDIDEQIEQGNLTREAAASLKVDIKKSLAALRDK